MSSNKRLRLSDPSSITPGASTSSSVQSSFMYDVFISFRGEDTRNTFVGHLFEALKQKGVVTFKDDEKMKQGKTIDNQLIQAIQDSRFFILVFSKNYASSSWCLDELAEIMDSQKTGKQTAYPVFFDVEPTQVRKQSGAFGEAFSENKKKDTSGKWIEALKGASNLVGWEFKATANGHEAEFIKKIVGEISLELRSISFGSDEKLVGMKTRVEDIILSLEDGIDEVRMIGTKGIGGGGKTTTARAVFDHLSNDDFEAKSFVKNVREVSHGSVSGLKNLQEQVLSDVLNVTVTLNSVDDGKNMMRKRMCGIKVLLVLDDVDHIEQLKALAGEPKWFKPGSRILITTRDEQVLVAHGVNAIRDIVLLSMQEAISLLSRYAFGRENPLQGYEELSGKAARYAAGLPLTLEVLGSFLCGKDKLEWVDAIDRLEKIPLQETLKKLELSYTSLEDDFKEIFLDIACILKGMYKEDAIRILECCGFHARNGLKVLEQRSLVTVHKFGLLGMHDHIEEMGKNIVRRLHPNEPKKHSRLWINEEIEDILANDMGTKATRSLKLNTPRGAIMVMKGLEKMKKLQYLNVNLSYSGQLDESTQYFPNSLKYLKCTSYPSLYLPKSFQANNLVGLEMESCRRMVQLWEEGEKKVLKKLKFLSLYESNLKTFDFRITPNLETLSLNDSFNLKELCMPASCERLNYLFISFSQLRTFDLGLTPNLETLSLLDCYDFEELHVAVACPNLKFLDLCGSKLRSLDLELIPNLERLDLHYSKELVNINVPVGCLKKVGYLNLSDCLRFTHFVFDRSEPKVSRSTATLDLVGDSLDLCPLHPKNDLPKLQFRCSYDENLPSSVGNIEKLISFGLCACTDLKKFSDMICSLQRLQKLTLKGDIPELLKDLVKFECLEDLCLSAAQIKYLPDSICMLKHLKSLTVDDGDLLEKLPEDLGQLECLEKLDVRSKNIEYLPDSVGLLKRLKYLRLDLCPLLQKLPEDLGLLDNLEYLNVRGCEKIEYLPDSICMLKRLNSLDVAECCGLGKLPKDIGQLECIEKLFVRSVKIEYLPDSICMLKSLKLLDFKDCRRLGKLPEDIGQLVSLKSLDLRATKIKHLPDSICILKHLEHLNLSSCALIEKLPEDLGRLECLKELDISYTGISHLPKSIFGLKCLRLCASLKLIQLYDFPSSWYLTRCWP